MKRLAPAIAGLILFAVGAGAAAQVSRSTPGQPEARTVLDLTAPAAKLSVTSPAFAGGADIPFVNTQYRGNIFPGLAWSGAPTGTKSFVVIMQDNSLIARGGPILHWTMFNIPGDASGLPAGMTAPPPGSSYGPNFKGPNQPYFGPRTPPGPGDNYHFEIFALDTTLPAGAGADFASLTGAMQGHILAGGEVVGVGHKDPTAP